MTIAKPPPSSSNKKEGVEESIILQQALYCIEDNYDVMTASPTTLQLITAICTNIVTHPNEEKFRKIKMANPKFNEFVMGVEGAINLLMLCGFEVDDSGEYIVLKKENFVSRDLQDLIAAIDIKTKNNSTTTIVQKSTPTSSASSSSSSIVKPTTSSSSSVSDAEMEERKKKMLEEKKKIKAEKEKIKQQLLADKEERKHLPTGVCSRKTAKPNTSSKKSFRDIGVDLNKGGG